VKVGSGGEKGKKGSKVRKGGRDQERCEEVEERVSFLASSVESRIKSTTRADLRFSWILLDDEIADPPKVKNHPKMHEESSWGEEGRGRKDRVDGG